VVRLVVKMVGGGGDGDGDGVQLLEEVLYLLTRMPRHKHFRNEVVSSRPEAFISMVEKKNW